MSYDATWVMNGSLEFLDRFPPAEPFPDSWPVARTCRPPISTIAFLTNYRARKRRNSRGQLSMHSRHRWLGSESQKRVIAGRQAQVRNGSFDNLGRTGGRIDASRPVLAPCHSFNRDAEEAAAHRSPHQRASPADTDAERGTCLHVFHGDRPRQSTLAAGVRWTWMIGNHARHTRLTATHRGLPPIVHHINGRHRQTPTPSVGPACTSSMATVLANLRSPPEFAGPG